MTLRPFRRDRSRAGLPVCWQSRRSGWMLGLARSQWKCPQPARRRWRRRRRRAAAGVVVTGEHLRSPELARLEAALFLAREPLNTRRLAKLVQLSDASRARALLHELNALLDAGGSAFRIEAIAGGYQLLTRACFGPWVRRILEQPAEARLSSAALETLAIVAYRQPITRPDIEAIRGVGSEEMLRQLLERDLLAIGGRSEELGRPNVYVTTRRFLRLFGLARIEELPLVPSTVADTEHAADSGGGGAGGATL